GVDLGRAVYERADLRRDGVAEGDVRVGGPLIVDEGMLHDRTAADTPVDREPAHLGTTDHARAEHVPRDRKLFRAVAEVARDGMENADDLGLADAIRRRRLEDVVRLVRIERTVLAAEDRM